MATERIFLSQREVVDNLNSTSGITPLSANQGRVLEEQIENIGPGSLDFIEKIATPTVDEILTSLPIGNLAWDGTNNQLTLDLTDTSVGRAVIFGNVSNYNTGSGLPQDITIRGGFAMAAPATYYFSETGALNTLYNLDTDISQTTLQVGFTPTIGTGITYGLTLDIQRSEANEILINGRFVTYDKTSFIGLRFEANTLPGGNNPIYSFGGAEDNADTGVIIPFSAVFTDISYQLSNGVFLIFGTSIEIYRNGVGTGTSFIIPSGNSGTTLSFSQEVSFVAGDRLSFRVNPGNQQASLPIDSILIGRIIT